LGTDANSTTLNKDSPHQAPWEENRPNGLNAKEWFVRQPKSPKRNVFRLREAHGKSHPLVPGRVSEPINAASQNRKRILKSFEMFDRGRLLFQGMEVTERLRFVLASQFPESLSSQPSMGRGQMRFKM
jgi:hypothetical protein